MLLPSASQALSATEGLGRLRECAEGVSVEDDGTAFADTAVEDDGAMFADAAAEDDAAMACWRRACVCASRWEGNSCSASLAGSRTFVEATRVRLVISVLFESEGWVIVDGIDKIQL